MTGEALHPHQARTVSDNAGFAAVLREGTQAVHREAERSGYIADLLRGRATRLGYAVYLYNLLPAYAAMERHLAGTQASPALKAFAAPGLFRAKALRRDIDAITGGSDAGLMVLPEAEAYAAAVECAADGDGIGLAAHAYARYLGDLSGGQILKPLLARTLDLQPNELTFYDFPDVVDIPACKTALRVALDTIEPNTPAAARVVDEAIAAFRHTIAVSNAVSQAMQVETAA